jgi:hypothetical protein
LDCEGIVVLKIDVDLLFCSRELGDQDQLSAKLSEAIEEIFKRHGLLVFA